LQKHSAATFNKKHKQRRFHTASVQRQFNNAVLPSRTVRCHSRDDVFSTRRHSTHFDARTVQRHCPIPVQHEDTYLMSFSQRHFETSSTMSFPRRQFDVISACRQYNLPRDVSSSTDSTTLTLYNGEGSFYTETARGRWSRDRISRQRSAVAERR